MKKHGNVSIFIPNAGCIHKCVFCNQQQITNKIRPPSLREVDEKLHNCAQKGDFDRHDMEIAFFGGSFTAIDRSYMLSLLQIAASYVENGPFTGIRFSTRPDSLDESILDAIRPFPVSAIEIGAQSMDDHVLKCAGRGHTVEDIVNSANLIKKEGYELVLQMMVGLPGDTEQGAVVTAQKILKLHPHGVRIYPVVVLKGTELELFVKNGSYTPLTVKDAVDISGELLWMFLQNSVKVLRIGLHSDISADKIVGGAFHPALRELCESKVYYNLAKKALLGVTAKKMSILVNTREFSKMVGQRRENIKKLSEEIGMVIDVKGSDKLEKYCLEIVKM